MARIIPWLVAGSLLLGACGPLKHGGSHAPKAGSADRAATRVRLFDGATLKGWNGNPAVWSVKDGAVNGVSEHGGQLILPDGDYADFRLILESRLVSAANHLGVCFWGDRRADWGYGECILVIPPSGGMWDYHAGKNGPPREKLPHPDFDPHVWHETEILAHLEIEIDPKEDRLITVKP